MSRWGEQAARAAAARLGAKPPVLVQSQPWCSVTFNGERHNFALSMPGDRRGALGALAEAELPLARGFVADVAITNCSYDGSATFAMIDLLTIDI